jgi:hypothetical protein
VFATEHGFLVGEARARTWRGGNGTMWTVFRICLRLGAAVAWVIVRWRWTETDTCPRRSCNLAGHDLKPHCLPLPVHVRLL